MSIGLEMAWTGSGLWRILLDLDWIRTVIFYINLGSGPDLDWDNGKICEFLLLKAVFCQSFGFYLDLGFKLLQNFGLWLDLNWSLKIPDWIWMAKYHSPPHLWYVVTWLSWITLQWCWRMTSWVRHEAEVYRIRISGLESGGIQHILNKPDRIRTTVLFKFPDQDFQISFLEFDANTIIKKNFCKDLKGVM